MTTQPRAVAERLWLTVKEAAEADAAKKRAAVAMDAMFRTAENRW